MGHDIVAQRCSCSAARAKSMSSTWSRSSAELAGANARAGAVVGEQAQLVFGLGQGDPEAAPGSELALRSPQLGHGSAGVAGDERIVVQEAFFHHSRLTRQEGWSDHLHSK